MTVAGKSLIVTGGSSGIGRALALLAAGRGADLVVADIDEEGGEATCSDARARGARARFIRADVSESADVRAMVSVAVDAYGRLDAAFNNAGRNMANLSLADLPEDVFLRTQAVNAGSIFLCMKYEIAEMLKTGGGAIVNTSSTAAISTLPFMSEYVSSKASVLGLTRAAALEYARQGVRVNAILPGATRTKMSEEGLSRAPEMEGLLLERIPMGRIAAPEEVASLALWLLSDEASIVTGACIPADGGLSIL